MKAKHAPELRRALIQELLNTYADPHTEGALGDFVTALHEHGAPASRPAPHIGTVVEELGKRKPGDPDLIRRVLRGDIERSPEQMIIAARKIDRRVKPSSFRATYNRMFAAGELTRRKAERGRGYIYRLKGA